MHFKRKNVTWEVILQGVNCAKCVRIIIGTKRDSKFIIIGGVKAHEVTEDQYDVSVAVLQ